MKSFLCRMNLFLRACVFSVILIVATIIVSFFCIAGLLFPLRYRYAIVATWTKVMVWVLKTLCKIDYEVEGLENIPKDRTGIVFSKHQSTWETYFLPSLFPMAAIILKRELLWIPFFGWGLASIEPIAINRSDKSTSMEQIIKQGKACLQRGRWIIVFPEGTRIAPGKTGKYRMGGARLATATGAPVIPVAHNAGRFWRKGQFVKKPGTIKVVIGPLIETEGRAAEDVMNEAKDWIESTMKRMDEK